MAILDHLQWPKIFLKVGVPRYFCVIQKMKPKKLSSETKNYIVTLQQVTFPLCGLYYLSLLFISASLAPCLSLLDDVVVVLLGQFLVLCVALMKSVE